jgi:hypothetical protein
MPPLNLNQAQSNQAGPLRRICGGLSRLVLWVVLLLLTAWSAAALYYDMRTSWLGGPLAIVYLVAVVWVWIFLKRRWLKAGVTMVCFALVAAWWFSLQPSNEGNWQQDVARTPYAEIAGNQVTIHDIRNCDYRTETDFDVRYYDKTVDLNRLRSVDLFMVYWGSPHIAHTMVSFGFDGGDYLCFSIETRKEKGESYSAIKGFFRQFELTYVVGDERDLVRLRTNYRKDEDVYLYRLRGSMEQARTFFLDYLRRMNGLKTKPEWYNALTDNCTTNIRTQRAAANRSPWSWRLILNGHGDVLLYDRGAITTSLPFADLKEKCHINAKAREADKAGDFSARIRQDVPGIAQ